MGAGLTIEAYPALCDSYSAALTGARRATAYASVGGNATYSFIHSR